MDTDDYIEQLNQRYFDGELSAIFLEGMAELPVERADVRAFVERMFRLMKRGLFDATDLSKFQGDVLGSLIARILPGSWEGKIPPITVAGRHRTIDQFIANNRWLDANKPGRLLDLGCGFPPNTTVELAEVLPHWQIIGGDPSLPAYLVHDAQENYATFDQQRQAIYFQPNVPSVENWNALLADSNATRQRFEQLLQELLASESERGPNQLLVNPIKSYERDNLSFLHGGIGELEIESVDVVRCFNVLFYFEDDFRKRALDWFKGLIRDGGILITGGNWALSTESRYYVFQKASDQLEGREFAFSVDNICPLVIVPWYTNHDDDQEVAFLAELVRVIRSDEPLMKRFYETSDRLRASYRVCPRNDDGFYGGVDPLLSPDELWENISRINEELSGQFGADAVEVLNRSGHRARLNEVGHIAVEIPQLEY